MPLPYNASTFFLSSIRPFLLQKGAGAPVREPVVDEQTQKEMMAFAYKRQEEWKKLEEADDDSQHNSAWANSSALKSTLHGLGSIRFS